MKRRKKKMKKKKREGEEKIWRNGVKGIHTAYLHVTGTLPVQVY